MKKISLALTFLSLFAFAASGTGCPKFKRKSKPVVSVPNATLAPDYFRHYLQLSWSGDDLYSLQSMTIEHSGAIEVIDGGTVTNGMVAFLSLDVQPEQHEQLAFEYEEEVRKNSQLLSDDPVLRLPARTCSEAPKVTGVCVRKLTLIIPSFKQLDSLNLKWKTDARVEGVNANRFKLLVPESGTTRLLGLGGNIEVTGGGADANIIMEDLSVAEDTQGKFKADLTYVKNLIINRVAGKVTIFLAHPAESLVKVDGRRVTSFPFETP